MFEPTSSRINGLDTLRAIAIVLVLMYHYSLVSLHPTFGIFSNIGWTGVDLFFVLSGYLIGNQILAAIAQKKQFSIKTFYMRRVLRTLPNYYVVLALYFAFPLALYGDKTASIWEFLTFTQNLGLRPGETFTHSWSLCIEEQFYLILPAVALLIARVRRSVYWGWVALIGAMLLAMTVRALAWWNHGQHAISDYDYYQYIYYSSYTRFDELLPGVALALIKNFHGDYFEKLKRHGNRLFVFGVVATAVMLYLFAEVHETDQDGFNFWITTCGYSLLSISFAILVMSALSPFSVLHRFKMPGAANLALWSYAIYLAHKPIYKVLGSIFRQHAISLDAWTGVATVMLTGIFGGWILFRLIETPFMRLREKLYSRGKTNLKSTPYHFPGPQAY
jgi:peptidoglycan/LPS O-acetylase OafA/YrhL